MELLVKNGDYEEILIDFDYENFTENWQKNTSWTIEFRLDKTVLNEFSYDLVENEAYIIHNQQYFVVKTCEPQAEGSFVYKNIIATHICYDVQFHHVHENMTKTARIAEYMSFALGNNKLGYTYEIIGDFGTTGVEVENFGDGMDALDMLQNICSKFNAVMIADNKHFRIIAEERWGEVTEKVFRYQYNTDNVQCSIDSTNLRTKMKLIGKTKEEDEGGGYYFAPFYIVSKKEEIIRRFGTDREQDPVSDERFIDSASIEKYGYEQLHDYYDISLSINNVGDESIEAGEQWIFIYEPLGIHEEVKIVGYKKYPYAKRKSGEAILSNENKDMISIYNQILSSTKRAEVMMANPKSFVISNMPTYVRTAIGSTLPLIVTDMEKVGTKIDDEIKQGQADKEDLEKQIQESEKAANEYADGKAQEWEVEFEKEREEITNEINTSQALAEKAAKTYTDGKSTEWEVTFAKEKGLINESITKSQAAAELAAKTYTDGKSTEWEVTFAKEKGLINESINSSEANAIATAKKYADSTTYIDSIKAKILVAESILADYLKVDKAMIDKLVTNSLFTTELFAQSAFVTSLKSKSLEAVYADIATLTTKILTADSVTATNLKVDQAMINKLVTNSLFTTSLFAQTAFVTNLKSKSLEAVYADIATLTTKILTADSVTATNLKVDKAMIDKLVTNSIFTTSLFAQTAFVTNLKSKSLEAVYADIATLKTKLLTADSIITSMIKADAGLFDKIFVNDAVFKRIVSNEGFFDSLMAKKFTGVEIEGGTITNPFNSNFNGAVLTGNSVLSKAEFNIDYKVNASGQTGKAYMNPLAFGANSFDSTGKKAWSWELTSGGLTMINGSESGTLEASALVRTQWINLPLGAAFTTAEGNTPQYRVIPQLDGSKIVKFRGQVKRTSGQFQPNQALGFASMPAGTRPLRNEFVQGASDTAYGGRFVVETNGAIQFMAPVATTYVSLTAISYYIS